MQEWVGMRVHMTSVKSKVTLPQETPKQRTGVLGSGSLGSTPALAGKADAGTLPSSEGYYEQ